MALGRIDSGTQSATGNHTLETSTVAGVFVAHWNLTDMVDGDVIRCWVSVKTITGDTEEVIYDGWYANTNGGGNPLVSSPPVVSMFSLSMGVDEFGANTVSVPWALDLIAEY
jgi:hypothetical protein